MAQGGPYRIGHRFGPYVLEEHLGAGAFKNVYRARNHGTTVPDEVVALGFPHQQDAEGVTEIGKEFALTARLVHPNMLRVYALERFEDVSFLVMEYLTGRSLRALLRDRKCLDPPEAVRLAGMVCEALAYAHQNHVLHRDVKPENVFITADGVPKLLDFGIARTLVRSQDRASTRVGTTEYMAPELLQGAAGTNADLWALGIMLYELLTGVRPFTGEVGEVIQKILSAPHDEAPLREKGVDNRIVRVLRKLLRKDPDARYQRADDLARDLEVVARRTRLVDDDESRIEVLIRASYPLICVFTHEEDRLIAAVRQIAGRLSEERGRPRKVYVWSASAGLVGDAGTVAADAAADPTGALVHAIENKEDAIYVFLDMHRQFTPVTTRLVRDAARAVRQTRKSVVFVSPFFQVPEELEKEVTLAVFQLPDREQLEPVIDRVAEECRQQGRPVELSDRDRLALVRAASGLTVNEVERALRAVIEVEGGLRAGADRRLVFEKTQVIRKSGILEYFHSSVTFGQVGGLGALMDWFRGRAAAFAGVARYAGLPQPKGVLLVGVPGCGKSLSAKALAGVWGVPLLRLDVGRIFGPLVGASEANLRRAIQTAEAVSPCILWIDEVEKGFSGVTSQSGGGVAARVFGTFLSWLQDKRSPVFVVATANDLSGIPPEFLRAGRFDDIFFLGLPDRIEREAILRIQMQKFRRDPSMFDVAALAAAAEGFSGAEIEQAVVGGLFRAFEAGREIETADIAAEIRETVPLSRSRAGEIAAMMAWARTSAKFANAS